MRTLNVKFSKLIYVTIDILQPICDSLLMVYTA